MAELPVTVLADGRLRLVRLLGEGGMGIVYEAYDRELRGPVALKMLRDVTGDAILRLKAEFRALRDLHHPNLVRLGELFADQRGCFFTMELVDGVDFLQYVWADKRRAARRIRTTVSGAVKTKPDEDDGWDADTTRLEVLFDEARLRDGLRQVAEGLAALHEAHKVHRDVKPTNVLVDKEGRVVLLDLGLAAERGDVTPSGLIEGTIEYMAPEQASGASAQPPVDLYAVGAILYEALVGRPPFIGDAVQVLVSKQQSDPVPAGALFPGVPPDLDELTMALLRRDPSQRPTARDVADGLASKTGWRRRQARTEPAPSRQPFVGRAAELAELHRAFRDSSGRPIAVLSRASRGRARPRWRAASRSTAARPATSCSPAAATRRRASRSAPSTASPTRSRASWSRPRPTIAPRSCRRTSAASPACSASSSASRPPSPAASLASTSAPAAAAPSPRSTIS